MKNAAQGMLTFLISLLFSGGGFIYAGRLDAGIRTGSSFIGVGLAAYLLPAALPGQFAGWAYLVVMALAVGLFLGQAIAAAYVVTQVGILPMPRRKTITAVYILGAGAMTLLVFLGLRTYLLEPFKVTTQSMYPTLLRGDRFLVHKQVPAVEKLKGVLVLYRDDSSGNDVKYAKRVVGLGGDMVRISPECKVAINGKEAEYKTVAQSPEFPGSTVVLETLEGHVHSVMLPGLRSCEPREFHVSDGFVFLLGDARAESFDSRHRGPIPYADVLGVPFSVWFSLDPLDRGSPRWARVGTAIR